ncbi:MAG: spermidine synthase [Acidobacteria bacterium]|nr:MAG: spermidine synthase [Acidobacteriota bacterium]
MNARILLVGIAFFLSGAAALIYQVTWQRLLALHSGVGIYSVAMIVAAFMVGLGLGSHLGGVLSVRLPPRTALLAFATLELAIGFFGLASGRLYYDWLYLRAGGLYATPWRAAILHFVSLALPTILMGMSLPLLVRAMVRDTTHAARTVGLLYGVNVLGACAGALVTPWVLVRFYGVREALLVAGAANLLAAFVGLTALRAPQTPTPPAVGLPPERPGPATLRLSAWAAFFALSGFCALSLEIVWFRIIDVAVKSTAFTFGTVLAVYLLGLAVGTFIGVALVGRLRRLLVAFLACECALLACSALAILALVLLPPRTPFFAWFFELWGGHRSYNLGGAWSWPPVWRLYVLLPLVLYGLPTVLMGVAFTVLQRAVHDDVAGTGRRVGVLQAANIAGCVGGSLLAGLVGLTWAGSAGVLRLLVLAGVVFAAVGIVRTEARGAFAAGAASLLALALLMPGERALWLRLHGLTGGEALVAEDATGVVALTPREIGGWRVWVNGRSHSTLPFGGIHTALGAAPALMHPAPRDVAVIGLGSGDTAWAAGCRREETQRVRVYEICSPQLGLLSALAAMPEPPPKLGRFLRDPRLEVRIADGRHAFSVSEESYDLIEMDPLPPSSPYSGNLYSLEFFVLCARRLRPGGVLCTWAPTARVRRTFLRAMPHVLQLGDGSILVGSNRPLALDLGAWEERVMSDAVRSYLGDDRAHDVRSILLTARPAEAAGVDEDINRDLVPRDEFNRP